MEQDPFKNATLYHGNNGSTEVYHVCGSSYDSENQPILMICPLHGQRRWGQSIPVSECKDDKIRLENTVYSLR